jgi:hypothetical protein
VASLGLHAGRRSTGDEFMIGDGRRFRIVGIVGAPDVVGIYNTLCKVEPVPH